MGTAEEGQENIFNKIIAENFPNPEKEMVIQVQEAFRTPNRTDHKRISSCHILIKTLGTNIACYKREWKRYAIKSHIKENPPEVFSTETLKARKAWYDVFQALKENNYQPGLLYPAKLSSIIEGEINTFHSKR
jgi:hypothetical protein